MAFSSDPVETIGWSPSRGEQWPRTSCRADRDQELLLPPSFRQWLPEDHLAWFLLYSVAELDLDGFYSAYRPDGWGAAGTTRR
jgi:hypothetical protein